MAERKEEHAEIEPETGLHPADCGKSNRAINPCATNEADVVGSEDVVDSGISNRGEPTALILGRNVAKIPWRRDADPHIVHEKKPPTVSMLS